MLNLAYLGARMAISAGVGYGVANFVEKEGNRKSMERAAFLATASLAINVAFAIIKGLTFSNAMGGMIVTAGVCYGGIMVTTLALDALGISLPSPVQTVGYGFIAFKACELVLGTI